METLKFYNRKKSLPVFVTIIFLSSLVKSANQLNNKGHWDLGSKRYLPFGDGVSY